MIFYAFAELFPASFREHVDRLRHDARYCAEFAATVKRLGNLWYEAPKWKLTVKLLRLVQPFCMVCGLRHNLVAHHKTYEHFGIEVLHMDDLQTLCQECHQDEHAAQLAFRFPARHHSAVFDEPHRYSVDLRH